MYVSKQEYFLCASKQTVTMRRGQFALKQNCLKFSSLNCS